MHDAMTRGGGRARERGAVLFVAVGILGLLAVLAVAFMARTQLERSASANYVDSQRAKLAAHAGLHRAVVEIQRITLQKPFDDNSTGGAAADPFNPAGRDPWIFGALGGEPGTPISEAQNLSFDAGPVVLDPSASAIQVPVPGGGATGPFRHKSGTIGGQYIENGDTYSLKVFDAASQINVNMINDVSLTSVLTALCAHPRVGLPPATAVQVANAIVARRPPGGYENKRQVVEAMQTVSGLSIDVVRQLRDMMSTVGYVDLTTLRPPVGTPAINEIRLEPRAPININTADEAVIAAVLTNIAGTARDGTNVTLPAGMANAVAAAIVQRRAARPFQGWLDFRYFLQGMRANVGAGAVNFALDSTLYAALGRPAPGSVPPVPANPPPLTPAEQALILANANPNSDLNKFHPDPNMDKELDKADLTTYTTELCFSSMGFFEIQSLGVIFKNDGQIAAETLLTSLVRVYSTFRDTTQRDFERGRQVDLVDGVIRSFDGYAWMGVLSAPEYSNLRDTTTLDLDPLYQPADYDGQLILNGLIRVRVLTDPATSTYTDYTAGFARGNLVADTAFGVPIGTYPTANPASAPPVAVPENAGSEPTLVNASGDRRLINRQTTGAGPTVLAELFGGAELMPIGVKMDANQPRFLQINEDNMALGSGTAEFWVKPTLDDDGSDQEEVYLHWGGDIDTPLNCIQIRRFRNAATDSIIAYFSQLNIGNREIQLVLGTAAPAWQLHEWHHIRVTYGKYNASNVPRSDAGLFVDGRPSPQNGAPFNLQRLILGPLTQTFVPVSFDDIFYDGQVHVGTSPPLSANQITTASVNIAFLTYLGGTGDFPEVILRPEAQYPIVDNPAALNQHASIVGQILAGNMVELREFSTGPVYIGQDNHGSLKASALFDNVVLQHFRADQDGSAALTSGFAPYDRYHDQTAAAQALNGALFRKQVALFTGQPVQLGTMSYTAIPAFPEKTPQTERGDLNVTLTVQGPSSTVTLPSGGNLQLVERVRGWIPLGGTEVGGQDTVTYAVDLTPPALPNQTYAGVTLKLPVTQSPVLDDVTVTYASQPQILLIEEGGDE